MGEQRPEGPYKRDISRMEKNPVGWIPRREADIPVGGYPQKGQSSDEEMVVLQDQTMEVDTSGMEDMASGSLKTVMNMDIEEVDTWIKT